MNALQWLPLVVSYSLPLKQIRPIEPKSSSTQQQISPLCENEWSDSVSAVNTLKICSQSRNLKLGLCIHSRILKFGLGTNVFVNNSLLNMYSKCESMDDAAILFDKMPDRTVVSWTSMISGYYLNGMIDEAISVFSRMLGNVCANEFTFSVLLQACAEKGDPKLVKGIHCFVVRNGLFSDSFLQNSLIDAYVKCGTLVSAEKCIEKSSCRDVVSWTSLVSGFVSNGRMEDALISFFRMLEDGVIPNEVTILSILQACSFFDKWEIFKWIHGLIVKLRWSSNDLVVNSLTEMYLINGFLDEGIKIFCVFCFIGEGMYLSPETMATLLQQCGHLSNLKLGEQIHGYLTKHGFLPCVVIENALIYMYAENERSDPALEHFTKMRNKDIVSWNTMITCLVNDGRSYEALMLLQEVHSNGQGDSVFPDFITMLSSLQACSNLATLQLGQVIHGYITRAGLVYDIFVQNALIDMYGKSGRLDLAEKVFEEMPTKDLGSWNSLIAAYGTNGDGISALQVFTKMRKLGIQRPNAITYVNILSACARAGMLTEGFEIFHCMEKESVIEPCMEHYACMVDLLGRSGRLEEAVAFIEKMPVTPGSAIWGALLGACALCGNVEMAERAARKLSCIEPESNVWRVALSNAYASVRKWEDAAKVRAEKKGSEGLRKEGGWSSVEVRGSMYRFMVNDTKHPDSKSIYDIIFGLTQHISDEAKAC